LVEYSFVDKTFHINQIVWYRLKSIDNDGSFKYSEIIEINTLPINYDLSQNYPNPFNPSTRIRYAIPSNFNGQKSKVIIKVYDILGNEVATLVNEEKDPGIYEVEFSKSNLASGIYIYQLKADKFTSTKKMILLR